MDRVNVPIANSGEADHNEPVGVKEVYPITQLFKMVDEADTEGDRSITPNVLPEPNMQPFISSRAKNETKEKSEQGECSGSELLMLPEE